MIPAIHTLFDAQALATHLSGEYEIGTIAECRLWRSFINDVYRLEAGGHLHWLRIHPARWRTQAETAAEISAILTIAAAGGAVARPRARRDGSHLLTLDAPEGPRVAVLFEDAPGTDLSYRGPDGAANARRYGEAVARLHDACDMVRAFPARPPMDLSSAVIRPAASLARHINLADQVDLARITEQIISILQPCADLTIGFCHGDLNDSNIHFIHDKAMAIDFDCCFWGWRAFELAGFARGATWHSRPGDAADSLIRAFFAAYRAHRPIAPADLAVQPVMLLAQRLWVTTLHLDGADRWGAINFGAPYAARFMDWLRAWAQALDSPPAWS